MNEDNSQIKCSPIKPSRAYFDIQLHWIVIFVIKCGSHQINQDKVGKPYFKYDVTYPVKSSTLNLS